MYGEACALEGKIVEGRMATLGEVHEMALQSMFNFGFTMQSQCRYTESEALQLTVWNRRKRHWVRGILIP